MGISEKRFCSASTSAGKSCGREVKGGSVFCFAHVRMAQQGAPSELLQPDLTTYDGLLEYGQALAIVGASPEFDTKRITVLTHLIKEQRLTLQARAQTAQSQDIEDMDIEEAMAAAAELADEIRGNN